MWKQGAGQTDDFDFASRIGADEDVLRLEVAVDQPQLVHELEALQALLHASLS